MTKKKIWIISIATVLVVAVICIFYAKYYSAGKVMVVSVSTDGNYAITTDLGRKAILWDLKNHKKKILSRKANIYSAYFIKNSHNLMWQQDSDNEVVIENVAGKVIKKFNPGFKTKGQVIAFDLQNYFAGDKNLNVFWLQQKQNSPSNNKFISMGQVIHLKLLANKQYSLAYDPKATSHEYDQIIKEKDILKKTGPLAAIALWDIKDIFIFPESSVKSFATLSPDGKYAVAWDYYNSVYVWNTIEGKTLFEFGENGWSKYFVGKVPKTKVTEDYAATLKVKPPQDFEDTFGTYPDNIFTVKFIDQDHYLRFFDDTPSYAILYKVTDPKPLKYLKFGRPIIGVNGDNGNNQSIDTSPNANILVTGKMNSGGILVYKYNPKTHELTKIWNSSFKTIDELGTFTANFAQGLHSTMWVLTVLSFFTFGILPFLLYLLISEIFLRTLKKKGGVILIAIAVLSMISMLSIGPFENEGMEAWNYYGQPLFIVGMFIGMLLPLIWHRKRLFGDTSESNIV